MTNKSEHDSHTSEQPSRRQFAKRVATTLIAAPIVASVVKGQTPPAKKEPAAPPNPQPSPAQQQQAQKPTPLGEAYWEVARVRFGEKLSAEQAEQVKKDLEGNVRTADRLRAVKLQNGDEPDFTFSAG